MAGRGTRDITGATRGMGGAEALLGPEIAPLRLAGAISVISGLLWLPQAWLAAVVLAGWLQGQGQGLGANLWAIGGFLLVALLRAFLQFWADNRAQVLALTALGRLRAEVLLRESQRGVPRAAGELASIVSEQLEMLRPFASRYLMVRMRVLVLPLAILGVSFAISWVAGLILLVTGPSVPVFMALIGQAAARASRAQLDQMGTMGAQLADRIAALPDIRLLDARAVILRDFEAAAADLHKRSMRVLGIAFLSSTVLELFAAIGVAMMAIFCGFSLLGLVDFGMWATPLTPVCGIFLLLLAPEFFQPLRDLAVVWHDRAAAEALVEVLDDVLDKDGSDTFEATQMLGLGGGAGSGGGMGRSELSVRGVVRHGIRYPDFSLAPGESLALTGPSGCGKTTLLRMIAGLERPDEGTIFVAGQPLDGSNADDWRHALGWMGQMPHFLDQSLEGNLRMGRAGDLDEALRLAAADHVIAGLDDGLGHRLGETGSGVSGGEARRLTLARALLGKPGLILADEPSADLDAKTAWQVLEGLLAAHRQGATLILATHDEALATQMSRQLDLGGGPAMPQMGQDHG